MSSTEKDFKDGFNDGYILAKHEPDLIEKITDSISANENEYCRGLLNGHKEVELEKIRENKNRLSTKSKEKDHDKEK